MAAAMVKALLFGSKTNGPHFGSPYNKDHNIFGSILGPPIYGSPHIRALDFWETLPEQGPGALLQSNKWYMP